MTARQVLEAVLIEMNKVNAPSLLLEDFNYLFNKAINQYINKRYNVYDVNQQTTDDIRVLKSTAVLKPTRMMDGASAYGSEGLDSGNVVALNALYGATYEVNLPADYLHILNCICIYQVHNTVKCYNAGSFQSFAAKRLTSDSWPIVLNNWYQRPSYRRPYYFLHNVNAKNDMTASNSTLHNSVFGDSIPTDPYNAPTGLDDKSIFGTGADYNATQWLYLKRIQEKIDSTVGTTPTGMQGTARAELNEQNQLVATTNETPHYGFVYIDEDGLAQITWVPTGWDKKVKPTVSGSNIEIYVATSDAIPDFTKSPGTGTGEGKYRIDPVTNFARTINLSNGTDIVEVDAVEKPAAVRLGNVSPVRLEVRYGQYFILR